MPEQIPSTSASMPVEKSSRDKKFLITVVVLVVLIVALGVLIYWQSTR